MTRESHEDGRGVSPGHPASRLQLESLWVTFGSNRVLRDVSLDVAPGEIHALIGQNGSGKSTLAKVLTGLYTPDPGARLRIDGRDLTLPVKPRESMDAGVGVVHQSLGLVGSRTVLENMRIGRLSASSILRRIDWNAERRAAERVFERLGRAVPLNATVDSLKEEERATVAIARALQDAEPGSGLIIFDESTRALGRRALEHFFEILGDIVSTGTSALLITHRLEEVVDASDRVTVLRDGRVVESGRTVSGMNEKDLTALMLGSNLVDLERRGEPAIDDGQPGVRVERLSGRSVATASFTVQPGEVLGFTGLAGSGYDDVPYLLSGAIPPSSGDLHMDGRVLQLSQLTPGQAAAQRIALVPEGREHAGLGMGKSVAENIAFPHTARKRSVLGRMNPGEEQSRAADWIVGLDIRPPAAEAIVGDLSGGNQQKVLLAKWLSTEPNLLLLHEPTQAVDVGARHTIVRAVREAARHGCAVIVAGSDENELALLCDRVLVLRDGEVREELVGQITPDRIVETIYASGSRAQLRRRPEASA